MPERRHSILISIAWIAFLISGFAFLFFAFQSLDYEWNYKIILNYLWDFERKVPGLVLQGLWGTFYISFICICLGSVLGLVVGLLLVSKDPVARRVSLVYVDVFRNTPVLVQLYIAYFVIGSVINLNPEQAGIITLSLFCAAYVGDILRGTLENFEKGQIDAAKSLGMSPWQVARLVVAPQAIRRMLPPLVGQFVTLVKDSSLVSVLGIMDLTKSALSIVSVTFRSFETWFLIAGIYLSLNWVVSSLGRRLEFRLKGEGIA